MSVKTSTIEGGIGLIIVKGSLVGGDETVALRQAVAGFAEREYGKVIIDLRDVNYMNSTAIGVLVSAHTSYTKRNWRLVLSGVANNIASIFVITKLTLVFEVFETTEEAAKALK
jgi:anti-sigma B factor antagonist